MSARLSSRGQPQFTPLTRKETAVLRKHTALAMMIAGIARQEEWFDLWSCTGNIQELARVGQLENGLVDDLSRRCLSGLEVAKTCPDGMMRMGDDAVTAMCQIVSLFDRANSGDALERTS
jgi:hypothetical protein